MRLSKKYELGLSFWEANPQLSKMYPFSELYRPDRTKNKERSSNIAWGIVLFCENEKFSAYRRFDEKEREKRIEHDFGVDFRGKKVQECIEFYRENYMSEIEKRMYEYDEILKRRQEFLLQSSYDWDISEKIDKSLSMTKKIYEDYESVRERFEREVSSYIQGGRQLSALEKGEL
jgi:hypothetical protein